MRAILKLFLKRWVLTLLGLTALSLLVWFVGPLFAFASYKPLEPEAARWVVIGALFAIWIGQLVWKWAKQLNANRQLLSGLAGQQSAPQSETERASAAELSELRRRMQEALGVLKKMRVKGTLGSRYVYQLPWYIIIGAPGAGKTTALLNSGLRFPLAERLGPEAIRGVGGTRNCDWWFTDHAVLLDTAGRYTSQDSDKEVDRAAWAGFLSLLKRHRGRRPINGVLVAVSLPDLLRQTASERERHARDIRQRLQELHDSLGIRFPIYALFTKCDLLAGFTEFFADLDREQRGQVWGVTFPLTDQPDPGAALSELDAQLDALEKRLNGRLLMRVEQERDAQRRTLIYAFPQELSAAKATLAGFLSDIFQANRFEERSMLRGVYLTSGTQEGTPLDRVMTSLARAYGLQQSPLPTSVATGKSYFIARLLSGVIFPEAELAGTNLRLERQRAWLRRGAYVGMAALAGLVVLGWLVSYGSNRAYIAEVDRQAQQARAQLQGMAWNQPGFEIALPVLGMLRQIPGGYDERDQSAPLAQRFGLSQTGKLGSEAQAAYERALDRMLLPRVVQRMEEQLRMGGGDFERQFETLKVYLMLNDPRRYDSATVQTWAQRDWVERASSVSPQQREELQRHTDALFQTASLTQFIALDERLVDEVRHRLITASPAKRLYERVKRDAAALKLPDFTVSKAAGPEAQFVLARKSGQPLDTGAPSFFTYRGYHEAFKPRLELALAADLNESWVLGGKPAAVATQSAQVLDEVRRLYFDEYISRWEALLNDVAIAPMSSLERATQVLNLLSRPDASPLRKFLLNASNETSLSGRPTSIAGFNVPQIVGKTLERTPLAQGEDTPVDQRFAGLHRIMKGDDGGKAPVDASLATLGEVYSIMVAQKALIDQGLAPQVGPNDEAALNRLEGDALRQPVPLGSMLKVVATDARAAISKGAYLRMNQLWVDEVVAFCRRALQGRYPVKRTSAIEATQADFGTFFGPGGKVETFYRDQLQPYLGPYAAPHSSAKLPVSRESMAMLENTRIVRDVFFRAGTPTPGLSFELKPLRMDAQINQFTLDVDGQIVRYEHGPAVVSRLTWPGPKGAGQVRLQIVPPPPSGRSAISEEGPWALNKVLDKAEIQPTNQPERFNVTFQIEGRTATFELRASSVFNPFRLQALERFECPDRL